MREVGKSKMLVCQRVITQYRYELLAEMAKYYDITIFTSKGEAKGSLKKASIPPGSPIKVKTLNSIKLSYTGESRSTSLFFYPQVIFYIFKFELILLEGTTNLLNNILIVPIAKMLKKRIIWWDAGYSLPIRSKKRKLIDFVVRPLIRSTQYQIAYSTSAREYMINYMGAKNCVALINTINTSYFQKNKEYIIDRISHYKPKNDIIKLLYVGAIEKRKKIKELTDLVIQLNKESSIKYTLTVVGGGNFYDELSTSVAVEKSINMVGPIYDLEKLKEFYFDSDLFVMPGDGGLAIVQALLFGLPAVCTIADGTEVDYLDKKNIFNNLDEIKIYLKNFDYPDKIKIVEQSQRLYSSSWVKGFLQVING